MVYKWIGYKYLCLLLLLFLISESGLSQLSRFFGREYASLVTEAEAAFERGEYQLSASLYEKCIEIHPAPNHYYDTFKSYLKSNHYDKSFFYLEKYTTLEWIDLDTFKKSETFELVGNDDRWKVIEDKIVNIRKEYQDIRTELINVKLKDQALRSIMLCAKEKFADDSIKVKYFNDLLHQEDSVNLAKVESIIKTNGWISPNKIGTQANSALWLVLQHASLNKQKEYIHFVEEAVNKGELLPHKLAYLQDRILTSEGKRQRYGSQYVTIEDVNVLYPVEDRINLNQIRANVGLCTIEDYLSFFDGKIWEEDKDDYIIEYTKNADK